MSLEKTFGADVFHLTARHGGINLHGDDGYYSNTLLGDDRPVLTASRKNFEPSFGQAVAAYVEHRGI